MTLIGKVLAGRYEILEEIGNGGMAVVYKAKCQLLNRFVAVKVLRPDLQNDEEFVRRFNVEAQAAASLAHPNIVSIYDVGYEDGLHYIVMEYIEGQTLKEYIEAKNMLPWREAVEFTIQIAKGLEQAHKNSIIHRDIKPHNIIMSADGVLKVTDFGIARANVQNTMTCEDSAIGSVHYISPEQARGGYTDERSDIYSLAVVLYEMLTGKVPFDSDRPVTVAIMHLQDKPIAPREYNISIPLALERIVMKAMTKEISGRYKNVTELIAELQEVMNKTTVANNSETESNSMANAADLEADMGMTRVLPVVTPETIASVGVANVENQGAATDGKVQETAVGNNSTGDLNKEPVASANEAVMDAQAEGMVSEKNQAVPLFDNEGENIDLRKDKKEKIPVDKKKSRMVIALAVVMAVITVTSLALYLGNKMGLFTICASEGDYPDIPNVVGMLYDDAVEKFENVEDTSAKYRFDFSKTEVESDQPKGTIIDQTPKAGEKVDRYKTLINISLTVSRGDSKIRLKNYSNMHKDVAKTELKNEQLSVQLINEYSDTVQKDMVIQQNPLPDSMVEKNSMVFLYISLGPDLKNQGVTVGDYAERDIKEVENVIKALGCVCEIVEEYSDTVEEGMIIKQYPPAGSSIPKKETITLYVSLGPDENEGTTVDNYVGRSDLDDVESEIKALGCTFAKREEYSDTVPEGEIIRQSPEANTKIAKKDKVTVYVSLGAESSNNGSEDDGGSQNTGTKKSKYITIYGPKDADSAYVEVKVDGKLEYSAKLKNGESYVHKLVSTKSFVMVEIYHDGELVESSRETFER